MPDDNPYYAPMRPEPSMERLNAPSSRVIVKNTSEVQNHIVIDRFNVGHELAPSSQQTGCPMGLTRIRKGLWGWLVSATSM